MHAKRVRLYVMLSIACAAGYLWLFYMVSTSASVHGAVGVCPIKHATGVPCPSCGSTRAVLSLLQGDFLDALYINPFGIIVAALMVIVPIWLIVDLVVQKPTLFDGYRRVETVVRKPSVAIPLVALVVVNWIWNITKGL